MIARRLGLAGLALLLFSACSTEPRPVARFVDAADASAPSLMLQFGPPSEGLSPVRISGRSLQGGTIIGEARSEVDGWRIALLKLEWFNNWSNGWTQASFLLDGTVSLRPTSAGWALTVEKAPQLDAPDEASIRYFDTYVRQDRGLQEFSRRWDRIQAVVNELSSKPSSSALAGDPRALARYLFPENYGYDSKPAVDHARVSAQGFEWNSDYTKAHFPGPLRALRDSGTLLRDFKESPGLWQLSFEWKVFWGREGSVLPLREN